MKGLRCIVACLLGSGLACGLANVLGITTDRTRMDDGDHRLAYMLFPVLMMSLVLVLVGYALRSRALFWIPVIAGLGSHFVPTVGRPDRAGYGSLEGAYMATLHEDATAGLDRAFGSAGAVWIAVALTMRRLSGRRRGPAIPDSSRMTEAEQQSEP